MKRIPGSMLSTSAAPFKLRRQLSRLLTLVLLFAIGPLSSQEPPPTVDEDTSGVFERVPPPPIDRDQVREDVPEEPKDATMPEIDTGSPIAKFVEGVASAPDRLRYLEMGADVFPSFMTRPERGRAVQTRIVPSLEVPFFQRGKIPKDAEMKLGRFYIDVTDLNLSVLHSDNVSQEEKDPDSDTIASMSLGTNVYYQLSDESYLAVSGAFVWLPFEGKSGIDGLGLRDIYSLGFQTLFDAELYTAMRAGGWDIALQDLLVVEDNTYEAEYSEELELYPGEDFSDVDAAGSYSFGSESQRRIDFAKDTSDVTSDEELEVVNTASISGERPVAEDSVVRLSLFHKNIWYPRNSVREDTDVTREAGFNATWLFDRKDWRFNPFAMYSLTTNNVHDDWLHIIRVGAEGPATDQIHLHADIGKAWGRHEDIDGATLWRLGYNHILGASSRTQIEYEQQVSDYGDALEERFLHTFDQIFGPKLRGRAFWGWNEINNEGPFLDYHVDGWGASVFWQILPVMGSVHSVMFTRGEYLFDSRYVDIDTYQSKVVLILNPKSYLEGTYEHRFRRSSYQANYRENIFRLTYSRKF